MSWEEGVNPPKGIDIRKVNAELEALDGTLDEDEALVALGKFLSHNLTFAANIMLGVELFPFQHIIIKTMMETDYTLAILGRGMSKSWSAAMFAGLYATLNQNSSDGVKIGIISATFRQSKQIFAYLEAAANKPGGELLKAVMTIVRGSDQWTMTIGNSQIVALPLGVGGEKLRGFRFNALLIDEFLLMPENTFNEVIMPFLSTVPNPQERRKLKEQEDILIAAGKLNPKDRYRWPNNKLVALSSASYKFEYLYQLYEKYENLILGLDKDLDAHGNEMENPPTRAIVHMSYEVAPPDLYDKANVSQAKSTFSESQFAREYEAKFTDDSSGFFKMSTLHERTIPHGQSPHTEIVGNSECEYILAVDPNASESADSDDFSMCLLKLDRDNEIATMVHGYNVHGGKLKDHMFYFHYLITHFNIVFLVLDSAGGVNFINACNESELFKRSGIFIDAIKDVKFDDEKVYFEELTDFAKQYSQKDKRIAFFRKFSTSWIRSANELLQANLDHKRIWFASRANEAEQQSADIDPNVINQLKFDPDAEADPNEAIKQKGKRAESTKIDLIDNQFAMVSLTKNECALIEVTTSPQGTQSFDLPANLKKQRGQNRTRRDAYTSLLLANWGARVYFDMRANRGKGKVYQGFTPFAF